VWSTCQSVTLSLCMCLCLCVDVCVVCVPVCDTITLSHCHSDNDKLLLYVITRWQLLYDNIYRWRPHSNRHQVLHFVSSVTHKMRFADLPAHDVRFQDLWCPPQHVGQYPTFCKFVWPAKPTRVQFVNGSV